MKEKLSKPEDAQSSILPLSEVRQGAAAYIRAVEARGEMKLRLYQLGYIPGEKVKKVRVSPLGDPSAYLVRGTVSAIRSNDAEMILVEPAERGE